MNTIATDFEIQDVERIIRAGLADCQIKGTLADDRTLIIRKGTLVCKVNLLFNQFLEYSYRANIRHPKILGILIGSLFIFPLIGTYFLWYLMDDYYQAQGKVIQHRIVKLLQAEQIPLATYEEESYQNYPLLISKSLHTTN